MSKGLDFAFHGQCLVARAGLTLWWPARRALLVADLHLGKSERMARRGGALLPPWESLDTIDRLAAEIAALQPQVVVSLGDAFDDDAAAAALPELLGRRMRSLATGRQWIWLRGNHDPLGGANVPAFGEVAHQVTWDGITLRHQSEDGTAGVPQILGHMHPVMRLGGRRWRSFAMDQHCLILPSFGSYTGGLDVDSDDFHRIMPKGRALVCTGVRVVPAPFPKPILRMC